MVWDTPSEEQGCQPLQHILMAQAPPHVNSEAFSGILIKDGQHTDAPAVPGPRMHKVVAPHMVPMFRAKPDAGAIIEPQSSPLRLSLGNLQAFLPPDALHTLYG
jgi:hypothetical protein